MSSVVHPAHYNSHPSGIEVLEYVRLLPFGPGNAVKYVMRRDHKGKPVEDIEKAVYYLTDTIDHSTASVPYRITPKMASTIMPVIAAEPDDLVIQFLSALYLPRRVGGIFSKVYPEPDLDLARETLEALRERYLVGEPPC